MLDFFKFIGYFFMGVVLLIVAILAAPTMWEQATSDRSQHPHSGATPDCPSWDISLEEGRDRAEMIRRFRDGK